MRTDDKQETRAIARYWTNWVYNKDDPAPTSAEAAAMFAIAHAIIYLGDQVKDLSTVIRLSHLKESSNA